MLLKKCLIIIALFFNSLSIFAQQNPTYSNEVEARIAQVEKSLGVQVKTDDQEILLKKRMKEYKITGLSIAVIKDYKIEWARGYGFSDKKEKQPVTTETLFQAASISKSLNAVGILKLAQDNNVDMNTDINNYLSAWKFPYDSTKGVKKITLNELLSHTGGTSVHGFAGYERNKKIPTILQILDGAAPANNVPVRQLNTPGIEFRYSGGGTTITQLLVMDVTGEEYDEYMQTNVLDPLGMKNSFYTFPIPSDKTNLLATGYDLNGNVLKGKYYVYPEQAAAGLWTNPTDLSHYLIELQLAYVGKSQNVLKQETVKTMMTPILGVCGLGVFMQSISDEKYFSHGGANEGFRCHYTASLEGGNGVVVMVNSDNDKILQEIMNSVATVYHWKDFYTPSIHNLVKVSDDLLDRYVGNYQFSPTFKIFITHEQHGLKAQATNQSKLDLFAEDQNKFFLKAVEAQMEFIKDESGNITKLILRQGGEVFEGIKVL